MGSDSDPSKGYHPPEREAVDCERCGDVEVVVLVDRQEPALCPGCKEHIDNIDVPDDGREITPMDKR
jgi:uncharacterized paraquat-inducible protein A